MLEGVMDSGRLWRLRAMLRGLMGRLGRRMVEAR